MTALQASETPADIATSFIDALCAGRAADAWALLDDRMQALNPTPLLKDRARGDWARFGSLEWCRPSTVIVRPDGVLVVLDVCFQRETFVWQVGVQAGRIAGLDMPVDRP